MSDLFGIFNIGKRGLATQQKAIGITSHNIANANTRGYSRQRVIIETARPYAMPSINNAAGPGQIGTGATVKAIQRIRDEFLDYQVRNESSTMGKYEARDKYLREIENIFNEPSEDGLSTLVGKFFDSWQQLSKQSQSSNSRTVVAQQSAALANELNHTYNQLMKLKENTQTNIKETVFNVNNMLNQLDQLNQQIMGVKISGQEPNDLMDRRDVLLDDLSKVLKIDIDKKNFRAVDVRPSDSNGVPAGGEKLLVRQEPNYDVSRFSYINGIEHSSDYTTLTINYMKNGNSNEKGREITINLDPSLNEERRKEIYRQIDECRVLWSKEDGTSYVDGQTITIENIDDLNKKLGLFLPPNGDFGEMNEKDFNGELSGYMSVQKDIDKYIGQMNKLAKAIAFSVNTVHSGRVEAGTPAADPSSNPTAADYLPFFVNKDKVKYDANKKITNLGEVLIGESEINAGNIAINEEILRDVMKIKTRTHDDEFAYAKDNKKDGESDGNRALAVAQLRNVLFKIQDIGEKTSRKDFIEKLSGDTKLVDNGSGVKTIKSNTQGMTTDSYFKDIVDELGVQEQEAKRKVRNQNSLLAGIEESRESVSGVSLDEEMANMIQYQHAYQANAKIIATVDELLDVVVNGLKR